MRPLVALLCILIPLSAARAQTAVLDLGSGDEDVIGLHLTANALREATDALPDNVTTLVLTLDSRGGFLAELPGLAGLLATELPARYDVTLVVREASSTAALLALTAPRLVVREDGFLGGHAPFERLGDVDLDLIGDDLRTAMLVADRCALLGDRPTAVARALTARLPLGYDATGALSNEEPFVETLHDGAGVLTLAPDASLRAGAADLVVASHADIIARLSLPPRVATPTADAVLAEHRAQVSERLARFDAAFAELERLLGEPLDDGRHARALDRLGVLETETGLHPRVGVLRGVDTLRLDDLEARIDERRAAFLATVPSTITP
ncbi:MAG: hypothetical protein AAGH64_03890 [Planctomycetota bacterium]